MTHQYIKLGKHYFCAEQPLVAAARFLLLAHHRLQLNSIGLRRRRAGAIIVALLAWRLRLKRFTIIELPVFGHLCHKVHGGYKVFDLEQECVTKVFLPGPTRRRIAREIESGLAKGQLRFAPSILRHDLVHRYYAETYIRGRFGSQYYGADLDQFARRFDEDIAVCLAQILLLQPLRRKQLDRYARMLANRITRRAAVAGVGVNSARLILRFIDHVQQDLRDARGVMISLGFSHGDFSMVNVLRCADHVAIIDWESAAQRSVLFDLYSYLFGELYFERARTPFDTTIGHAIRSLDAHLRAKTPQPLQIVGMETVYRQLFYLERLRMIAERREANRDFARTALRTVKTFSAYEAALEEREARDAPADNPADNGYRRLVADTCAAEPARSPRTPSSAAASLLARTMHVVRHTPTLL